MPEKAFVLDANLLVLLVVGLASPEHIAIHKRLGEYSKVDFDLLTQLLADASRIVVTPNTLTEAVNLSAHIAEPVRSRILLVFRDWLERTQEIYVESARAMQHPAYSRLGLTDCVLLETAAQDLTIITADVGLYVEAGRQGRQAINFNHYRENIL